MTRAVLALATCACMIAACGKGGHDDGPATTSAPNVSPTPVSDALRPLAAPKAAAPPPAAPARTFGGSLAVPSDLDVVLVFYDHVGTPPPLDRWAADTYEVRTADEFKKEALQKERVSRLQSQFDRVKGVGKFDLTTRSELGQYSTEFAEFHLSALAPGREFVFSQGDTHVSLLLVNAADFYRLPIARERAEKLADRYSGREVSLQLTVALDAARPELNGGTLEAHITHLRAVGADGTELAARS